MVCIRNGKVANTDEILVSTEGMVYRKGRK
jgi:hypothetical protein